MRFRVAPTIAGIGEAEGRLRAYLGGAAVPEALVLRAELVLEEVLANVVRHAGLPPSVLIVVEACLLAEGVRITVEDPGPAFDPEAIADNALLPDHEESDPGGLGLRLIRRLATARAYQRTSDGTNRFQVTVAP